LKFQAIADKIAKQSKGILCCDTR